MEAKITITGKPISVNNQYTIRKGSSQRMLTSWARAYGDSVGWQAKSQWRKRILTCNLEVSFYYYFENNRTRDHLNFNKVLCDRLNQIVWKDDKQIKISHHYTMIDEQNPRVEIIIKEIKCI